jgi:hypothetical protein
VTRTVTHPPCLSADNVPPCHQVLFRHQVLFQDSLQILEFVIQHFFECLCLRLVIHSRVCVILCAVAIDEQTKGGA